MFTWLEIGKIQETEIVFKCCCCLLCGGVFVSFVVFIHTRASLHVRAAKHTCVLLARQSSQTNHIFAQTMLYCVSKIKSRSLEKGHSNFTHMTK